MSVFQDSYTSIFNKIDYANIVMLQQKTHINLTKYRRIYRCQKMEKRVRVATAHKCDKLVSHKTKETTVFWTAWLSTPVFTRCVTVRITHTTLC